MPRGRPPSLPEPWRSLAIRLGGVGKLALVLGVAPRTIRDWAVGQRIPRGPAWFLIQEAFGKAGLPVPERGTPVLKPRNDPQKCLDELEAGLREYRALRAEGSDGLIARLRMASALVRIEAAGIALERLAYSAALSLASAGERSEPKAQQRCAGLIRILERPAVLTSGGECPGDARLDTVLREIRRRCAEAVGDVRIVLGGLK